VCVTGGAGFIGSHLVAALVDSGAQVRILDDFTTGERETLAGLLERVTLVEGSILDPGALDEAISGAEVVFHHAARVSVAESMIDPELYREVNVGGTEAVLSAASRHQVRRLVYAGSCSAYGDLEGLPKCEGDPVQPTSPYAASKLAGEELVAAGASPSGLDTARLRYFNVYGPRQAFDSPYAAVVPRFMHALASGECPVIYGDGGQTRDFVHVQDVVQANLRAGSVEGRLDGRVFNVGSGDSRSILGVLEDVARALGVEMRVEHEPARDGEVRHSEASIAQASEHLGYAPTRSFFDALVEMASA
jgi:UDP-glucose 4-epimerase